MQVLPMHESVEKQKKTTATNKDICVDTLGQNSMF